MATSSKPHTVRVTDATHRTLRELTARTGESMTTILARAVDRERREQLLAEANAAWAVVLADPQSRAESEAEDALWEGTLADGLEAEEW